MNKVNGYSYAKHWFEFAFENCDKVTATHGILFFWLVELNNRLGWVKSFQITSSQNMQAICCKSYNTYKKCFDDLIDWGFVQMIKQSKNQYQCNVIALSNFDKAHDKAPTKAIDKAVMNHLMNHNESTEQSIDDIHKTINNKTINNKTTNYKPDPIEILEYMNKLNSDVGNRWTESKVRTEAQKFFNYYESNGWLVGKNPMQNWKASAINWMNSANTKKQNNNDQRVADYIAKHRDDPNYFSMFPNLKNYA